MDVNNFDLNDPRIQLIVTKQQLRYNDDMNALQRQLDLEKQKLMFLQEAINRSKKEASKKRGTSRFQAFLADLIFLFSTILIGFGISMLTSTTPSPQGWFMIILGITAYLIGALMTLAIGKNNE